MFVSDIIIGGFMGATVYSCNDHFFRNPLTEHSAYWVGFLAADGCIWAPSEKNVSVNLRLQYRDAGHIQEFLNALESNHPITHTKANNSAGCSIHSTTLAADLALHGVIPKKSWNCRFPTDTIPIDLMPHYLRGYIDGDGSIRTWVRTHRDGKPLACKKPDCQLTIVGTNEWNVACNAFLQKTLDLSPGCIVKKPGSETHSTLSRSGARQVRKILHYTHDGATIALRRKWDIVLSIFAAEKEIKNVYPASAINSPPTGPSWGTPQGQEDSGSRSQQNREESVCGIGPQATPCTFCGGTGYRNVPGTL